MDLFFSVGDKCGEEGKEGGRVGCLRNCGWGSGFTWAIKRGCEAFPYLEREKKKKGPEKGSSYM